MKRNEIMKRVLSFCLAVLMLFSAVPMDALAAVADSAEFTGTCEHHTQHDGSCGFVPAVTGKSCTHEHIDCGYIQEIPGVECDHVHVTEECGYVQDIAPVPCDHKHSAEYCGAADVSYPNCGHTCGDGFCNAEEAGACDHVCGTEVCGQPVTTWPQCTHSCTDGSCSYSAGVAGSPCSHDCADGSCSFREKVPGAECSHKHDTACGFVAEVKGSECTYHCEPCAAYDAVVALFEALPKEEELEGSTEESRAAMMQELEVAFDAHEDLWDQYEDMGAKFDENYVELILAAQDLNMAILNYDELVVDDAAVFALKEYDSTSRNNMTITVTDGSNRITGATITVTRDNNTYEVQEQGNGQYKFTRDETNRWYSYSITVEKEGYRTETVSVQANNTATTVTLESGLVPFRVYYKADGKYPTSSYQGSADASLYGPSGDDTPLVVINVDLNKLDEEYSDVFTYRYSNSSSWYYIPRGSLATDPHDANVKAFWNAVWACTTDESKAVFRATGFSENDFYGYVLKKQASGDSGNHLDGILTKEPPMYVVELYYENVYFGGSVTGSDGKRQTLDEIREAADRRLGYPGIQWTTDGLTGIYFVGTEARSVGLTQRNSDKAVTVPDSEIKYQKVSDLYYLAQFDLYDQEADGYHTVTYTDGVDTAAIFPDQGYAAKEGETVPPFIGEPKRDGHEFLGWHLVGDTEHKMYSADDIAKMTVTTDMVFHAHWYLIPTTFEATVYSYLDGIYDSQTKEVSGGSPVDITTVMGAGTELYLKEQNGTEYIPLTHKSTGCYSATVGNGNYHIYFTQGGGDKQLADNQFLTINGADRSRYAFFNSVAYNLNGGSNAADFPIQYYLVGSSAAVSAKAPVREGYVFTGWKEAENTYQSGDTLTTAIGEPHVLVAQWEDAMDVYVNITIHHNEGTTVNQSETRHNLDFTLDYRTGSSGDYEEVYSKSLAYEDGTVFSDEIFALELKPHNNDTDTVYTSVKPVISGVPHTYEYTFTTTKTNYHLVSVQTTENENGDLVVDAVLQFAPQNENLTYKVKLNDAAKKLPAELKPTAVNVKVTCWYEKSGTTENWYPIGQHESTYTRVVLDANGEGTGNNSVWIQADDTSARYYRIEVVSYEYQGTNIPAVNQGNAHTTYVSQNGRFSAEVSVDGGSVPDSAGLQGAYFSGAAQQGEIVAVISIPVHTVTFNPNGGTLNGKDIPTVLEDQLVVPVLENYVPIRTGGYVFEGWYLADDAGNMTETTVTSGSALSGSITLIAKWKEPRTITVNVDAAATYQQIIDGETTTHTIDPNSRVSKLPVSIQKKLPNGYMQTIWTTTVNLTYAENSVIGTGYHEFKQIPDDGSEYAVLILAPNYFVTYQNEPESLSDRNNREAYSATDTAVVFGTDNPGNAVINSWLKFDPASFNLQYQVDASAIGEGFRPESVELLVTCDDNEDTTTDFSEWPVITQMVFAEGLRGNVIAVDTDGKGTGSTSVWVSFPDGSTLYEYAIRSNAVNGTVIEQYPTAYSVSYQAPAVHTATGQSRMLIAKFTPNSYPITYDFHAGSDTVTGMTGAVRSHIWSHTTPITAVPVRDGYTFLGWYTMDDNGNYSEKPVTSIPAERHEETVLHAKWLQVQDSVDLIVTLIHRNGEGVTNNYDKNLKVQLLHALKGSNDLAAPVAGMTRSFHGDEWHTNETFAQEEIFTAANVFHNLSSEYTYDLSVQLDEYYVVERKVTAEPQTNGSTKYVVEVTLQYLPDRMNFTYSAEMAPGIDRSLWPSSVNVRVTCWYSLDEEIDPSWHAITQHSTISRTIPIGADGSGSDSYSVWQWLDKEKGIPYYYRIEVLSLNMPDGSIVSSREIVTPHVKYALDDYTATIETSGGGYPAGSALPGAYGSGTIESGVVSSYSQIGTVKAVISIDRWNDEDDTETGGDDVEDHKQALIRYESEDSEKGTVTGAVTQIFTLSAVNGAYTGSVDPVAVALTPNAANGYEFSHWTLDGVTVEAPFAEQTIDGGEARTYIAHWKLKSGLSYTVNHWAMDAETGAEPLRVTTGTNKTFGDEVDSASQQIDIPGYVYDHAENETLIIGSDNAANVINLYYAVDVWGGDEDEGDDIPDYKQALILFQSGANGAVSGKTEQLITLTAQNSYSDTILPEAVTATPNEGYRFDYWTMPNNTRLQTLEAPFTAGNEITVVGGEQYVYTVNWTVRTDCTYTVKYLEKGTTDTVAEDKVVTGQTYGAQVTEAAISVNGYDVVDGDSPKTLTVGAGENTIIFYYTLRKDLSLTVNHYDIADKNKPAAERKSLIPSTHSNNLTFGSTPNILALVEPIEGFEYVSSDPASITIGTGTNVVNLFYQRLNYKYTVHYHYEGIETVESVSDQAPFGFVVDSYAKKPKDDYVLDYVTGIPLTISAQENLNNIHVYYSKDLLDDENDEATGGDGIPDKYQTSVTFRVINGTWETEGTGNADILKVYTLYTKSQNGQWTSTAVTLGTLPTGKANNGHTDYTPDDGVAGTWNPAITASTPVTQNDARYVLSFIPESYTLTAIVVNGSGETGDTEFKNATHTLPITYSDSETTTYAFTPDTGFALDTVTVDGQPAMLTNGTFVLDHEGNHTIRVVYDKDNNGDGKPDKYQARVTYDIIGGTWKTGGTGTATVNQVYTLFSNTTGVWLPVEQKLKDIPTGQANEHYVDATPNDGISGTWSDPAPTTETNVPAAGAAYTLSYELDRYNITAVVRNGTAADEDGNPFTSVEVVHDHDAKTKITFAPLSGYALDVVRVDGTERTLGTDNSIEVDHLDDHNIVVYYEKDVIGSDNDNDGDPDPDGIPDKYQSLVIYRIEYGSWVIGKDTETQENILSKTDIVKVFNHYNYSNGSWSAVSNLQLGTIPTGEPDNGYNKDSFRWEPGTPTATTPAPAAGEIKTYVLDYDLNTYTITIVVENGTARVGNETFTNKTYNVQHNESTSTTAVFAGYENYILESVTVDGKASGLNSANNGITVGHNKSHVIHVIYTLDRIGEDTDKNGTPNPDGIPDKYQSMVTYKVIDGYWTELNTNPKDRDIIQIHNHFQQDDAGVWQPVGSADLVIPVGAPNAGFQNGIWRPNPHPDAGSTVNKQVPAAGQQAVYTLSYTLKNHTITVWVENGTAESGNQTVTNGSFQLQVTDMADKDNEDASLITFKAATGYTLDEVLVNRVNVSALQNGNSWKFDHDNSYTIHVVYSKDELDDEHDTTTGGDGIPDKYQAKVEYRVVNGHWTSETSNPNGNIVQIYTLKQKDADGVWQDITDAEGKPAVKLQNIPTGEANTGYSAGSWSPLTPTTSIAVPAQGATYTLTYTINRYIIRAEVVNGTVKEGNTDFTRKDNIPHDASASTILSFAPKNDDNNNYVLYKVTVDNEDAVLSDHGTYTFTHTDNHSIRVVYELDNHGTEGPNKPDGIPDIFQKKITYRVHNGTFGAEKDQIQRIETYVTLLDTAGKPSASGIAVLTPPANMTPATGYTENGQWDVTPPATVTGTTPVVYDYRFSELKVVDVSISVVGGTSNPVESVERHEYSAQNYDIVFTPNANHILDKVTVNGKPDSIVDNGNGTYTYTYQRTADFAIEVVFVKDEWKDGDPDAPTGGDGKPDYQQAIVRFVAGANGQVSGDVLNVYTFDGKNGTYSGSVDLSELNVTVTPAEGYRHSGWIPVSNPFVTATLYGGQEVVHTAQFEKDDFDYTVKYYFDGKQNQQLMPDEIHEAEYLSEIELAPAVRMGADNEFLLDTVTPSKLVIGTEESKNLIEVYYVTDVWKDDPSDPTNSKDADDQPDEKPDYQQAMIKYVSAGNGMISGAGVQVFTLHQVSGLYTGVVNPESVTPVPAVGYKFTKWTYPDGTDVPADKLDAIFAPHSVNGGDEIIYTAHFERDSFGYTVEYYFDGVKNPALQDTVSGTALYGEVIQPEIADKISHYILETKAPENGKITVSEISANNVLKLYYVTDNWRDDPVDPSKDAKTGGDGTPDKYQVLVKFESSDENKGTVTGTGTLQVYTFAATASVVTVEPRYHDITIQPKDGYALDYWSRDDQNLIPVIPDKPLMNVNPGSTIVFKAQFAEDTNLDDVPDKYQATVTYKVENGTWSDGETKDIEKLFTLRAWNSVKKVWEERDVVLGDTVPAGMKPDAAHVEPGYWGDKANTEDDPTAETKVTENAVYKFTYGEPKTFTISITVVNGVSTPNETALTVAYGEDALITFAPNTGYAFDFIKVDNATSTFNAENGYQFTDVVADHVIHVEYALDEWGGENGDGIPDYRQALVKFKADTNGKLEGTAVSETDGTAYFVITLPEEDDYEGTFQADGAKVTPKANEDYAFDYWTMTVDEVAVSDNPDPYKTGIPVEGGKVYELTAHFAADTVGGGDDVPDYKQAFVYFEAGEHGTIDGTNFFALPLTNKSSDGTCTGTFTTTQQVVKAVADTGYMLAGWTLTKEENSVTSIPNADPYASAGLAVIGGGQYTFAASFAIDNKDVTYPDVDEDGDDTEKEVQSGKYIKVDPNGGIWHGSTSVRYIQITADYVITDPLPRSDYVFLGWNCREAEAADDGPDGEDVIYVFTAQWDVDAVGGWDNDGEETGDGVPDRYQKKVTFRIVNGYWADHARRLGFGRHGNDADIVYYLTLRDADGKMSETGTAVLKDLIPTGMRAKRGYHKGKWDVTPPDTVSGTDSVVYTYKFVAKPSHIPKTGDYFNMYLWIIVMALSAVILLVVVIVSRKRKNRHNS